MSAKATFWAWRQNATGTNKLVLLALADAANHDDMCWPSKTFVAAMCGVSPKTVQRAVGELIELGLIECDQRFRADGSKTSNRYHLRVLPGTERPGTPGQSDPSILEPTQKEPTQENTNSAQASFLPDPIVETWELYVRELERPKVVLTPKVRKWIREAHEAVGPDETRKAIRGLAASDYHREKGYIGIEHAIRPKQNETIEGRVAFMVAKLPQNDAPGASEEPMSVEEWIGHFATSDIRRVARASIDAINKMVRNPDDENAQLQGTVAVRRLGGNGYRPVVNKDGYVVTVERL